MNALINSLSLVYPPFSNQEGEWLKHDCEVREHVRDSKLYMIGHRGELTFVDIEIPSLSIEYMLERLEKGEQYIPFDMRFKLKCGDLISPTIKLSLHKFLIDLGDRNRGITFESGDKIIRIKDTENDDVLEWATPDAFLFKYSHPDRFPEFRKRVTITEPFELKRFSNFELYYVGISKKNDSFSRLFSEAHHGRLKILSNETQKNKEARLTDELMLLLFKVEPFCISSVISGDEFGDLFFEPDETRIIADAEKAFIKLMGTKYNEVKYSRFPDSVDGLYGEGLNRYSYHISEDITLHSNDIMIMGSVENVMAKEIDVIGIDGDMAKIIRFREDTEL